MTYRNIEYCWNVEKNIQITILGYRYVRRICFWARWEHNCDEPLFKYEKPVTTM